MTDQERAVMQQALDFIRAMNSHGWLLADYESDMERTVAGLEAALAQEQAEPVQEPVGEILPNWSTEQERIVGTCAYINDLGKKLPVNTLLYTAPAQVRAADGGGD